MKNWFVVHCLVDLAFAIPLFLYPEWFLALLRWPYFDPIAIRLVAAALFGIGLESWLGREGSPEQYRGMLRLKIIWSAAAVLGILLGLFPLSEPPLAAWALALVFAGFNGLWVYWYRRLAAEPG